MKEGKRRSGSAVLAGDNHSFRMFRLGSCRLGASCVTRVRSLVELQRSRMGPLLYR